MVVESPLSLILPLQNFHDNINKIFSIHSSRWQHNRHLMALFHHIIQHWHSRYSDSPPISCSPWGKRYPPTHGVTTPTVATYEIYVSCPYVAESCNWELCLLLDIALNIVLWIYFCLMNQLLYVSWKPRSYCNQKKKTISWFNSIDVIIIYWLFDLKFGNKILALSNYLDFMIGINLHLIHLSLLIKFKGFYFHKNMGKIHMKMIALIFCLALFFFC